MCQHKRLAFMILKWEARVAFFCDGSNPSDKLWENIPAPINLRNYQTKVLMATRVMQPKWENSPVPPTALGSSYHSALFPGLSWGENCPPCFGGTAWETVICANVPWLWLDVYTGLSTTLVLRAWDHAQSRQNGARDFQWWSAILSPFRSGR